MSDRQERAMIAVTRVFFASVCVLPLAALLGDRAAIGVVAFLVVGLACAGWPLAMRSK